MSVITGFIIVLMVFLLGYMAYRLFLRRRIIILVSFCMQVFSISIAFLSFFSNVQPLNVIQAGYIFFGVMIPGSFLIYDYARVIRKVKEQGIFEGFVEALPPQDKRTEYGQSLSEKFLNPIMKELPIAEIANDLALNTDDILKNIKKSLSQAQTFIGKKNYESAYEIYSILVKLVRDCSGLYYNYANLCYYKGDFTEASHGYKKVIETFERKKDEDDTAKKTGRYMVYYNLGNSLFKLDKYELAIDCFEKALEINPCFEEAKENTARALMALNRDKEAIEYFKKIINGDNSNYRVHYIVGKLYDETGRYDEAAEEFRICTKLDPSFDEGYEELGRILAKSGRHIDAAEVYGRLTELRSEEYTCYYYQGTSYYHAGLREKAIECFKKVIRIKPDDYRSYFNMAVALDESEKQEEAIIAFRQVISLKEEFVDAYNNLGIILSTQGRYLEALGVYIRGLKKNPEEYSLYYNLGITLSEMGRYTEAIDAYTNALEIKPDEYEINCHLAAALMELKKYTEAVAVYKSIIKYETDNSELFYNLAIVYSLLHKYDIAVDNLRIAIDLNNELKADAKFNKVFDVLKTRVEFRELVS